MPIVIIVVLTVPILFNNDCPSLGIFPNTAPCVRMVAAPRTQRRGIDADLVAIARHAERYSYALLKHDISVIITDKYVMT